MLVSDENSVNGVILALSKGCLLIRRRIMRPQNAKAISPTTPPITPPTTAPMGEWVFDIGGSGGVPLDVGGSDGEPFDIGGGPSYLQQKHYFRKKYTLKKRDVTDV